MLDDDLGRQMATFRFGLIADFVTGVNLEYGEKGKLLAEKAARRYTIPGSKKTSISRSAILAWIDIYVDGGRRIEALMPKVRCDKGTFKHLETAVRMGIKRLKEENPRYTVPVIIKKLQHERILAPGDANLAPTIYRYLRQENLNQPSADAKDRRRFETAYPNEIWQCDVMHGPMVRPEGVGPLKKVYLLAIIDDHSRLIIHAEFYLTESFDALKDALRKGIQKRGIPRKFYADNGACYRADHLEQILAALGVALTHSRPYTPQGRGKIERWFRTCRDCFLPMLPTEPLTLMAINERLDTWVDEYNNTEHSTIKQTPTERYRAELACVRPAPERLIDYFRKREYRRVKKDRTVQLNNRVFEVPAKLIDKTIELLFHEDVPEVVEVMYQGLSYGAAHQVDVHVNARIGRNYGDDTPRPVPKPKGPQPERSQPEVAPSQLFDGLIYNQDKEV